ncbi:LytR/AlgR family response regulator transcription factor [Pleomorphovibrio marinus]|uniref:LytR/AlgR family response regulator transcription factor n=1 Tax=Pleomorphovibrio marinus TaxID=2164132 RepID=UPI000E0B93C4|nr:LytTR family DNA-binding domain-containing protein [Pleomorphovibrio marinus]
MTEKKVKCIAVDDEPLALGLVCGFINQTNFLELEAKFENAIDALSFMNQNKIDLVFLDIQMPDLSGMELARILEGKKESEKPKIIFTTAYDQFAIEGYKVSALDYLLKPFGYEEFLKACSKILPLLENEKTEVKAQAESSAQEYIFIKVEYQLVKVLLKDIICVEGYKDYVKVHLESKTHPLLSLTSLKNMEELLPSETFMRVHRSFIISLDHIQSVTKNQVDLGTLQITVSDLYKENFLKFMNKWMN